MGQYDSALVSSEGMPGIACVVNRLPDPYPWGGTQLIDFEPDYRYCRVQKQSLENSGCTIQTEYFCYDVVVKQVCTTNIAGSFLNCVTKFPSILDCRLTSTHRRIACPSGYRLEAERCVLDCAGSVLDAGVPGDSGVEPDAGADGGSSSRDASVPATVDAGPRMDGGCGSM